MPLASYVLPTYQRPEILKHTVRHMQRTRVPDRWELEIVICAPAVEAREHRIVQSPWPVRIVSASSTTVGAQLAAAIAASRGELVLRSGDDDLQSPHRLEHALAAWKGGAKLIGFRGVRFVDLESLTVSRWDGPADRCGTVMTVDGELLRSVRFDAVERYCDAAVRRAMGAAAVGLVEQMSDDLGPRTVCLQHGANISGARPFPPLGKSMRYGSFRVTGLGSAMRQGFDEPVKESLLALHARRVSDTMLERR